MNYVCSSIQKIYEIIILKNKRKILFRADGNSKTGLGHLFRLFALYEMLKADYKCVFLTRENSTLKVIPKNYNLELLPDCIAFELEPEWITKKFSAKSIIIADGYQFNSNYQKAIKQQSFKLVYIDDLVQEYMYADIIINHAPGIKKEDYEAEAYTKFALGIDYAILRPLFLEAAKQKRIITKIDTAFVCFGGSDINDLTLKATKALLATEQIKKINIVIGAVYQHKDIFRLQNLNSKINIYKNLSEKGLITVMRKSNFAIAPASTILFELLAVKMPILSGYYMNNQSLFYNYLLSNNIIHELGNFNKIDFKRMKDSINKIQNSNYSQVKIIDGKQKQRINKLIKAL
jgi:UDP-2,4-diacetamido-2,4,6-trideoxy-beta-L-altropyranose hydrolase